MPSLYQISVPVLIRGLGQLSYIIEKGENYATTNGIPKEDLLSAKLIDDMQGLIYQVQRVSDTAKGLAVRIAGTEPVAMPDNEKNFEDLQARIAKTIKVLEGVSKSSVDDKENSTVTYKRPSSEIHYTGTSYVLEFVLPNFFFHITAAYAILRHKGVPIGKLDYLGPGPE